MRAYRATIKTKGSDSEEQKIFPAAFSSDIIQKEHETDYIKVLLEDITEEYPISLECLADTLKRANWGEVEISLIINILRTHYEGSY